MRLLLDTNALLWLMSGSPRLKPRARALIESSAEVFVSTASIWEIAIKWRLGKIEEDPEIIVESLDAAGLRELPVSAGHAVASSRLPLLHRDPFDRLLVAQAICEPMRLVTGDERLLAYSDLVIRI